MRGRHRARISQNPGGTETVRHLAAVDFIVVVTPYKRSITCVTIEPAGDAAIRTRITRHGDPHVSYDPDGSYVVPVYVPPDGEVAA